MVLRCIWEKKMQEQLVVVKWNYSELRRTKPKMLLREPFEMWTLGDKASGCAQNCSCVYFEVFLWSMLIT